MYHRTAHISMLRYVIRQRLWPDGAWPGSERRSRSTFTVHLAYCNSCHGTTLGTTVYSAKVSAHLLRHLKMLLSIMVNFTVSPPQIWVLVWVRESQVTLVMNSPIR